MDSEAIIYAALTAALPTIPVYASEADQDLTPPVVTYDREDTQVERCLSGAIWDEKHFIDVHIYGIVYQDIFEIAATIRAGLDLQSGAGYRILYQGQRMEDKKHCVQTYLIREKS